MRPRLFSIFEKKLIFIQALSAVLQEMWEESVCRLNTEERQGGQYYGVARRELGVQTVLTNKHPTNG